MNLVSFGKVEKREVGNEGEGLIGHKSLIEQLRTIYLLRKYHRGEIFPFVTSQKITHILRPRPLVAPQNMLDIRKDSVDIFPDIAQSSLNN